ncbi:unnamed protein product [Fraxinus pennsylvanica]|uniref:RNase H type-1 domain-containing protein n=1 Tax=Fraxinus pennsylvanica TaxID=56036 RepID=A0AAD2EC49_9LAMI|nr:unnamed protein product [Fraxinus pennsylvanica]
MEDKRRVNILLVRDCWIEDGWDFTYLKELVGETKAAEVGQTIEAGKEGSGMIIWKPNDNGEFSTSSAWGPCGGGRVIMDHYGNLVVGFCVKYGYGSNNEAELHVVITGVELCKEKGFQRVVYREANRAIDLLAKQGADGLTMRKRQRNEKTIFLQLRDEVIDDAALNKVSGEVDRPYTKQRRCFGEASRAYKEVSRHEFFQSSVKTYKEKADCNFLKFVT